MTYFTGDFLAFFVFAGAFFGGDVFSGDVISGEITAVAFFER
jgi:hypothetical protein